LRKSFLEYICVDALERRDMQITNGRLLVLTWQGRFDYKCSN